MALGAPSENMRKMKLVPLSDVKAKILQSRLLQNVRVPPIYKRPTYIPLKTSNQPDVKAKLIRSKLLSLQKLGEPITTQFGEQAVQTDFQELPVQTDFQEPPNEYLNQIRKTLLRRYVDHIDKALEFLEHTKGYKWNDSGEIINAPGVNLIYETEKITA